MIHTLLAVVFLIVFTPLAALIAFPWTFLTGNADFLYNLAIRGVRAAVWLAGIKVQVEGRERLDRSRSYIFMCNHVSNLDPPVVIPVLPGRTSVLVKKEVFRVPILGWAMHLASLVPVDRSNREAAIASIAKAAAVLQKGIHMTIFPEGTRSLDGRLLPFKKGPFHLALDTGYPVVPVTILGTLAMMPKGQSSIRPGVARVIFHQPIDPQQIGDRDALMLAVARSMAGALPTEVR